MSEQPQNRPAAGWYPDPEIAGGKRYWDGDAWTDERQEPKKSKLWLILLLSIGIPAVLITIVIVAAVAIPVFLEQRQKAEDTAAKADVSTLGKEVATYWVDGTVMPDAYVSGGSYYVDGQDVGPVSANVQFDGLFGNSAVDWCVQVTNPEGDLETFRYSVMYGLEAGTCSDVAVETSSGGGRIDEDFLAGNEDNYTSVDVSGFQATGDGWQWSTADRTRGYVAEAYFAYIKRWPASSFTPDGCEALFLIPYATLPSDGSDSMDLIVEFPEGPIGYDDAPWGIGVRVTGGPEEAEAIVAALAAAVEPCADGYEFDGDFYFSVKAVDTREVGVDWYGDALVVEETGSIDEAVYRYYALAFGNTVIVLSYAVTPGVDTDEAAVATLIDYATYLNSLR